MVASQELGTTTKEQPTIIILEDLDDIQKNKTKSALKLLTI